MKNDKEVMRQFLHDRNKKFNQFAIRLRLLFMRVVNIQRARRVQLKMQSDLERGLGKGVIQLRGQLRDSIMINKALNKRYSWIVTDINKYVSENSIRDIPYLHETIQRAINLQKILRQINMIRWMAYRNEQDNLNGDDDESLFTPTDVKTYHVLIDQIVEHQTWESQTYNKELQKKYQAAYRVILGNKEGDGEKSPSKRKEGGLKRSPTKLVKATAKLSVKEKTKKAKTKRDSVQDDMFGLTDQQICKRLKELGIKPPEMDYDNAPNLNVNPQK